MAELACLLEDTDGVAVNHRCLRCGRCAGLGQGVSFAPSWILPLEVYWYIIVFPGVALLLYGLGWNLIGDALRDILDPKLRGKKA